MMLAVANQFTGIVVIFQYAKQLFVELDNKNIAEANKTLLILGFFQVAITLMGGFLINKFGRRPMMLTGFTIIVLSLLASIVVTLVFG